MSIIIKPQLRQISLCGISGYHPAILGIANKLADLLFCSRLDVLSKSSIRNLLTIHPVHIASVNENHYVFSGFRSYQLALSSLECNEKFAIIMHSSISESEIIEFAQLDLYGTALLHSLGTKSAAQLKAIKNHIGLDAAHSIAPELKSQRSITCFEKL